MDIDQHLSQVTASRSLLIVNSIIIWAVFRLRLLIIVKSEKFLTPLVLNYKRNCLSLHRQNSLRRPSRQPESLWFLTLPTPSAQPPCPQAAQTPCPNVSAFAHAAPSQNLRCTLTNHAAPSEALCRAVRKLALHQRKTSAAPLPPH